MLSYLPEKHNFVLYDPIFFFTSEQLFSINAFHVGESFLGRIILSVIYSRFTFWGRLVELYDAVYWNEIKCSESRVANCKKPQRQIIINILLLGSHRFLLYEHFNDHLIITCDRYFYGINQPVPFWDIHLFRVMMPLFYRGNILTKSGSLLTITFQ